jgi:hypothetical protein
MLQIVFIYVILALLSLFPIIIWAYSFSFIDNNPLNRKRFLIWMLAWIFSVFPILYMEKIVSFSNFEYLNVFYFVYQIKDLFSSLEFSLSLSLFLLIIILASFVLWWFIWKKLALVKIYLKNFLVFLFFIFILGIFLFITNSFLLNLDFPISSSINFWNIVFDTFRLIIFYYLIVAFIEEAAKHFNFLQSSVLYIKSVKDWVLYAIFVALWFSFIENLLYLWNYYENYGTTYELLKLYFFRSAFSVIVHILSSSIIAYYFSKALILYRNKDLSFSYLKIFCFGLVLSILLHLIFDISLSLGFISIIFIYFVGGYLYVSSIFYKE